MSQMRGACSFPTASHTSMWSTPRPSVIEPLKEEQTLPMYLTKQENPNQKEEEGRGGAGAAGQGGNAMPPESPNSNSAASCACSERRPC